MKKQRVDSNLPIGKLTQIKDELPPPEKLVIPEDTIKVTLLLSKSSVKFFKRQAARHGTKYQKMIRQLVDRYAEQYQK
jgi:predicted DNA binding CopG/RHH family protein